MIVVTTPTGQIGGRVLEQLLETGENLRVIARDPGKLSAAARKRVEIVTGSHDDVAVVAPACEGAAALLLIVPPSLSYENVDEYYLRFGASACEAIESRRVARVVFVSGTGLGVEKRAGAVSAAYLVEKMLADTGAATRVLHCGSFMENLLHSIEPLKRTGRFSTTVAGDVEIPWVATRDIAGKAVELLLDETWSGHDSAGLLGPEDLSYNQIAGLLSEVLGREIRYEPIAGETLTALLRRNGATEAAARSLVEIYDAMEKGVFNLVPRSPETSTPTTMRSWCEEVFRPAFGRASAG